jgi:hypothetical protein
MNSKKQKKISNLRYLSKLKKDQRLIIFGICLLIATSLWFLDALSKDYTTTLSYSVKYVNPPGNLFLANNPPSKLDLRVEAHGFTLLRHKLAFSFSPLLLDLTTLSQNIDNENRTVQVTSENLIRRIGNQVSKEISISDVSPRTISLEFDSLETKLVQLIPQVTLHFKPQFNLSGSVTLNPDSVYIYGPAGYLDTLTFLYTEPKTFQELETSIEQSIRIQHPRRTSVSPERTILHVPVEKFTEKKITLPLEIVNMPDNAEVKLFPPQVTVSVMVNLTEYENVTANDFKAMVDYNQVTVERETLDVYVESKSAFSQSLKVSPHSVEYLIETE